ncbi:MAG: RtcB family protein [Gammaproteobacteria bacterium]|nr:RtcB family protein [Gammaproteobacteria bacterium]
MRVPARIYASSAMLVDILKERAVEQLINMTTLPGILRYALAMPDIHQGYGFPIGGVAAFSADDGIISPGGVGYDINCGVRLLTSDFRYTDIRDKIETLVNHMHFAVPSGVGSSGNIILNSRELDSVLDTGVNWARAHGMADAEDLLFTEEQGCYQAAAAKFVSAAAKKRGADQLGTLGAGNHFVEIQEVVEVYAEKIAAAFGIFPGQVTVMIHTGSRGLGHQVCTDYVKLMLKNQQEYGIYLADRQLACAPFNSKAGQEYFQAMAAAANFAWCNRQVITHNIRQVWAKVFGASSQRLKLVYDVAHNIAKLEKYQRKQVIVHRKGATRAFGPKERELPKEYQATGQPVFIPGSMGTNSYVLAGTKTAMQDTFGSTCHGAGRAMSRMQSKKIGNYKDLHKQLADYGVIVRCDSVRGLLEEAPKAYKDVDNVVEVVSKENIAVKVAKLKPVAVIKG